MVNQGTVGRGFDPHPAVYSLVAQWESDSLNTVLRYTFADDFELGPDWIALTC